MDRVLTSLTTIKLTQQVHSQLLAQLLNSAETSSPALQGLPDLPFGTLEDLMEWEAHLDTDKDARLQMVKMLYSHLQLSFGEKNQEGKKPLKKLFSVLHRT